MDICDICERAVISAPTNIKLRHSARDAIFDLSLIFFPRFVSQSLISP
jgi:hypothetical protein